MRQLFSLRDQLHVSEPVANTTSISDTNDIVRLCTEPVSLNAVASGSEGFITDPVEADNMSQATTIVLGTVVLSAVFAVGIILSYVFA